MKKWFGLLIATVCLWMVAWCGCLKIDAPEKVDVKADTNSSGWNRTAQKYASQYADSDTSKDQKPKKHEKDDDDDEDD